MPPLLKTLRAVGLAFMLGVFGYGLVFYIDAPIHVCNDHDYCGKTGRHHTFAEYHAFKTWEMILFMTWIIGIPALLLLKATIDEENGGGTLG